MTADELYIIIKKLVVGLESTGFKVIAVITDNNAINCKAMTKFVSPPKLSIVYPHPSNQFRPLFFFFDTIHLWKYVRNNWLNIKSAGKCISFPHFAFGNISTTPISTEFPMASFGSLRYLHDAECDSLVKFAYKLPFKALNLSTFERQNVKLALQVFNNFTAQALTFLGKKTMIPHHENTSTYIRIITTWWQVVNVKTPLKGKRLQNVYEEPITKNEKNCELWKYLQYFVNCLDQWSTINAKDKPTKETFTALHHTTTALLEISEYCLEELNANYVLLGKFQTDCLEARFDQYRQLAGGQHNISLRQIYECEKKNSVAFGTKINSFRKRL